MPKRSGTRKAQDANELAASIVAEATGERVEESEREKNPAAVALGRRGGKKGGKARMEKLTPAERTELARKAARKRWGHEDADGGHESD